MSSIEGNPSATEDETAETHHHPSDAPLFGYIRANELGRDLQSQTAFGLRPLVYADYTASGRALAFVEDYVREAILPTYGNTHTSTTKTGRQSSDFVAEARVMIKNYLRCNDRGKNADRVLFAGSGATAGANRLVAMLGLLAPTPEARAAAHALPEAQRPVVFVGPYEHHSNLLPWRESVADVVSIGEAAAGGVDLHALEAALRAHAHRPLRVGAFSAASNVTGILSDVDAITALLHTHGALAVWDYASAAPYAIGLAMNPPHEDAERASLIAKDALFFSPHKFAGGPQAAGILVYKKALATRGISTCPGGGTVFYVSRERHVYLKNDEEREEGGTPSIVGAIRAGLVLQLQKAVGAPAIARADGALLGACRAAWGRHPRIAILGHPTAKRLPIFALAFRVTDGTAGGMSGGGGPLLLHHNYVVALLNDLFGIQARGGCMCAGPYSQQLLGIDGTLSDAFEAQLVKKEDNELLRPGYVRLSLPYFADAQQVRYVLDAVHFVAEHGWKLLPQYLCDARTAEWRHVHQRRPPRAWLGGISYAEGALSWKRAEGQPSMPRAGTGGEGSAAAAQAARFEAALAEAHALAKIASSEMRRNTGAPLAGQTLAEMLSPEGARLRWFLLPGEAAAMHRGVIPVARAPFEPPAFARADAQLARPPAPVPSAVGARDGAREGSGEGSGADPVGASLGEGFDPFLDPEAAYAADAAAAAVAEGVGSASSSGGAGGSGWATPDTKLSNRVLRAILQYGMLRPGDRVLVGLSGGKDSLAMLHILHALQKRTPFQWELGACTVDPGADGFDPSPLIPYCAKLGLPYFYEKHPLLEIAEPCMAKEGNRVSICSFCSRMKRGVLYATARREGYNVLAMAQHLDDLAESFLMSAMHNGALRSMKAHYTIDAQDLRVIRPLAYVREHEAEAFSESVRLPIVSETCPACFEAPKERYRIKCLLATQEALFPTLFQSLLRTMLPLLEPEFEDLMRLRREAYGRIAGPPHVPPPISPPSIEDEAAARRAQATHGQYDARAVWSASLALSRRRLAGGGRGCSQQQQQQLSAAAEAAYAAADDLKALQWFSGSLDADGNFVSGEGVGGKTHAHGGKGFKSPNEGKKGFKGTKDGKKSKGTGAPEAAASALTGEGGAPEAAPSAVSAEMTMTVTMAQTTTRPTAASTTTTSPTTWAADLAADLVTRVATGPYGDGWTSSGALLVLGSVAFSVGSIVVASVAQARAVR